MLLFPKMTLGIPHGGGRAHHKEACREVVKRLGLIQGGQWEDAWKAARGRGLDPRPKRSKVLSNSGSWVAKVQRLHGAAFVDTLTGLMQDGAFSKAVKHLV